MTDLKTDFPLPQRVVLDGRYCRLEPIGPQHAETLYAAASGAGADDRFRYLFNYPPADRAAMEAWIFEVADKADPLYFGVIEKAGGRCEGRQSLMRMAPRDGCIEMGGVYWGPAIARTRVASEAFYLFARYVFETLGYRRLEWKCNDRNTPSRKAALRFGFAFEGIFRQHMIQKGENRDTAWFAMLDADWPRLKPGFKAWLDPANFDANGRQKARLAFA